MRRSRKILKLMNANMKSSAVDLVPIEKSRNAPSDKQSLFPRYFISKTSFCSAQIGAGLPDTIASLVKSNTDSGNDRLGTYIFTTVLERDL